MIVTQITIMMMVSDVARADIVITPQRTYYRFATDCSIEDGELKPVDDFDGVVENILGSAVVLDKEKALSEDIKVQLFVNNRLWNHKGKGNEPYLPTEQSLARVIDCLVPLAPEFAFLSGFKS